MERFNFLVVGGAGFIGSNMVDFLMDAGHDVTIIDNLSTGKISNVNRLAKFLEIDITKDEFSFDGFDYVIHMAATPNVQQSIDNPILSNRNNFQTTLKIIEGCKNTSVKKIIFSSTSAIYGDSKYFPTSEKYEENPMSPYALDKLMSEKYLKLYSELYGIKSVCLRYFNVFGERMTSEGAYKSVISVFRGQKEKNVALTITNDGSQRRDFVYVGDVVYANYLSCINETGDFNLYNVGFGENISVNEIASYFNQPTSYIGKRVEPFQTLCDNTKIVSELGWNPTISVKDWISDKK
jgi:nucleoside-diphosphate-sugar epimerase